MRAAEPGTIIEPYVRMFGGRYRTASIVAGVVLFLVGFGIAVIIGFGKDYLTSHQIYLGVFGVTWATWWVAWGARRMCVLTERIRPIFLDPPGRLQSDVAGFEKWAFNWPLQFRTTDSPSRELRSLSIAVGAPRFGRCNHRRPAYNRASPMTSGLPIASGARS